MFNNEYVPKELRERYIFSKYLIDPNKFRFRIVLRILALVFLFIQKIQKKCNKRGRSFESLKTRDFSMQQNTREKGEYVVSQINVFACTTRASKVAVVHLLEDLLNAANRYYFVKAAAEVKHFVNPSKYETKSVFKDGILYYTGRILPMQKLMADLVEEMHL